MTYLKKIRINKGYTQNEVASIIGVKLRHYQYLESGNSFLTQEKLNKLEDLFEIPQRILLAKHVKEIPKYYHDYRHGTENHCL